MDAASPWPPALINAACSGRGPRPQPPSSAHHGGHQGSAQPPQWLFRGTEAGERRLGGGLLSQTPFLPQPARTHG